MMIKRLSNDQTGMFNQSYSEEEVSVREITYAEFDARIREIGILGDTE